MVYIGLHVASLKMSLSLSLMALVTNWRSGALAAGWMGGGGGEGIMLELSSLVSLIFPAVV